MAASAVFVLLTLAPAAAAAACTSGVIQVAPPSSVAGAVCMSADADSNSVKAICGAAFRVTVANSIIRLAPLEQGSVVYSGPGPFPPPTSFDCKYHNASGLFLRNSTTAATLMLYDNRGGPLSNLTKTGPSQLSLAMGRTYSFRGSDPLCTINYTVVSGCVLDAKPATSTPPPCSPGYISKTGRFGLKYCAPCPKGTYSPGGATAACIACPIGTANRGRGQGKCEPCDGFGSWQYGPKTGLEMCQFCARFENNWTDGKTKCEPCPAGSTPSVAKPYQCVRCYAGKKCCTVNWDKNCPKCTSNAKPATYTSIFALESAAPASCMASPYALCASKINVTIDGTCTISVTNQGSVVQLVPFGSCLFASALPIQGAVAKAAVDLAQLTRYFDTAARELLSVNVTGAASPYLAVSLPSSKCTLRYRALTSPAAKILGAAPKPNPAPAAACPAGSYIDTTTDTKPGPCLPCPAGTISTKAGTSGPCTPCPPGTYASKFGSTSCTPCPSGKISQGGAAVCLPCTTRSFIPSPDGTGCNQCAPDTSNYYPGAGVCIGNMMGSRCCAAGLCTGQPSCSGPLVPLVGEQQTYQAVFRLKSRSVSSPTCRNGNLLSCLPAGAKLVVNTNSYSLSFDIQPTIATTCATNATWTIPSYFGGIATTKRALIAGFEEPAGSDVTYELLTARATNTLTIYLSTYKGYVDMDLVTPTPAIRKECSATFELVTGYFLDLQQPASTACPASAITTNTNGRTVCQYCGFGNYKNATGACQSCPFGTYQPFFDGTTCKPCSAGYLCYPGAASQQPCNLGRYSVNPATAECLNCPPGTFSGWGPSKACTKCPKGTIAPVPASKACGVPPVLKF